MMIGERTLLGKGRRWLVTESNGRQVWIRMLVGLVTAPGRVPLITMRWLVQHATHRWQVEGVCGKDLRLGDGERKRSKVGG